MRNYCLEDKEGWHCKLAKKRRRRKRKSFLQRFLGWFELVGLDPRLLRVALVLFGVGTMLAFLAINFRDPESLRPLIGLGILLLLSFFALFIKPFREGFLQIDSVLQDVVLIGGGLTAVILGLAFFGQAAASIGIPVLGASVGKVAQGVAVLGVAPFLEPIFFRGVFPTFINLVLGIAVTNPIGFVLQIPFFSFFHWYVYGGSLGAGSTLFIAAALFGAVMGALVWITKNVGTEFLPHLGINLAAFDDKFQIFGIFSFGGGA